MSVCCQMSGGSCSRWGRLRPPSSIRTTSSAPRHSAVVFKPAVVQTPAILTILVFLGRLVAGLVPTVLVHPSRSRCSPCLV